MMDSSEEQMSNYYAEDTVFVAVGKHVKDSESVVTWAARKFAGKKRICILHVHQPAQLASFFDLRFTASKFKQTAVKAFRELNVQKLHKLIGQYILLFSQLRVRADRMWIEMDNIEEGIVKMIAQHGIKWLVMGAAADKHYTKEMAELKSQKAIFVCEQAPASCHIWFTCKGNLIYTREGPGVDISLATASLDANVATKEQGNIKLDDPGAESIFLAEGAEHVRVEGSGVGRISLDSDVTPGESEFESPVSNDAEEEEEEDDDDDEDGKVYGYAVHEKSLDSNVSAEEADHTRTDCIISEHISPPRLTVRERGSILRACSVDFDSHTMNSMVLSCPQNSRDSNNLAKPMQKEGHQFESKRQMFSHCSSLNSALLEGKMEGEARLRPPREIHDNLERAISDAENMKQVAFQESVNRWKAEEDVRDAKSKVSAAESKYNKEMNQRKQLEETLEKQKLDCTKFKYEYAQYRRELPVVRDQCSGLQSHIRESEIAAEELEEKILSAVELLISFRAKRDQLQLERDKAMQELENLKRIKEHRTVALSGPQFPTFSLLEIGEATCSFDPTKRIGDGKYGSIYQGTLRHMDVAIRMLPNDGFQGQRIFEHKVEILSRVRHPNIVVLIGVCAEARSIVYEYLERGSLEDHLACRGKNRPLQWQTRVRIATELCSALIFLHTNSPPFFHGNLKLTKILLDANFVSKIGDLGIFRLISNNQLSSEHYTQEYTDPEFLETGVLTPDSDVYSFGIILLQLLTGKAASGIVQDVRRALQRDKFESVLDASAGDWPINQAKALARMALQCCERHRSKRPGLASGVRSVLEALRKSSNDEGSSLQSNVNPRPPSHFLCPIFQEVMKDPCTAADGYTYEGDAIREWLDNGHKTSPMTNLKLSTCDLIPNHALQYAIQEWLQRS